MPEMIHDVVLYGATGFTGRQTAEYFASNAPAGLRWAIAGRNAAKLEMVRARTGAPAVEVADSGDAAAIDRLVARTRVLLTTAGPFAQYGTPVVEACVRHRVHYVDITGETVWVRDLIDRYHAAAAAAGTRIVPFCGFDSVPSDLGTLGVVTWMRDHWSQAARRVSASFRMRGGLNGGTLATALHAYETGTVRGAADVLLLNPPGHTSAVERTRSAEFTGVSYDPLRRAWLSPFVMASINTRVVRRSNALLAQAGEGYGPAFAYQEALEHGSRAEAILFETGRRGMEAAFALRLGRQIARSFGPRPGQGPSEREMNAGFMRVRLLGESEDGRSAVATLSAQGDPGNRITVKILCEAALALATDLPSLPGGPRRGGILTPATALGLPFLARLQRAGIQWSVEPVSAR